MPRFARADLLALTLDGLTQLANAGLVKRALREQEAGNGPQLSETDEAGIEACFADGTRTRLPAGKSPGDAHCTCPASGMCRHRVSLVLAYQAAAAQDNGSLADRANAGSAGSADPALDWNPADIPPEAVEAMLTPSTRNELQRLSRQALEIHLEPGAVPSARLPMATVRFLVPNELAYARCDCVVGQHCAHVALAVRAFQMGRAQGSRQVTLGQSGRVAASDIAPALAATRRVVQRLLREGVSAGPAAHGQELEAARRAAEQAGATWLALALIDLEQQIHAYTARSARYSDATTLALATEIHARAQVAGDDGARENALGIGEAMESAMATTRLISLGARVYSNGDGLLASVLLADTDTGATLVFEKNFTAREPGARVDATALTNLRFAPGLQVRALARGQLLTAVARRRADGLLVLGAGRGGKTSLMPHAGHFELPAPLSASSVQTVIDHAGAQPPSFLRPRHRARDVRLFKVQTVLGHAFAAGAQHWQAAVELADDGGTLFLERGHDAGAPRALDILFAAADGHHGAVRQVVGPTRIEDGKLICEPWALSADTLVVPDVDTPSIQTNPPSLVPDRERASLPERIAAWLAEAVHLGARGLPRDYATRGTALAAEARQAGYVESAARVDAWLAARGESGEVARFGDAATWVLALMEDGARSH
ncbi:MAG TPA: hypothetical protein PLS67_03015 [Accumulibacter sp.]|nr:hypothetical protein [Accumulibacter sp.]